MNADHADTIGWIVGKTNVSFALAPLEHTPTDPPAWCGNPLGVPQSKA